MWAWLVNFITFFRSDMQARFDALTTQVAQNFTNLTGRIDKFMAQIDDLTAAATALKASVDAETAAIVAENAKIDEAVSLLQQLETQAAPDLSPVIALLQGAKANIDNSATTIQAESTKLDGVLPAPPAVPA
jgi:phage protein D